MKRRRSNNKAIKIDISFQGEPTIRFIADVDDDQGFKTSVEKIDFKECVRCDICERKLVSKAGVCRHELSSVVARHKTWEPIASS